MQAIKAPVTARPAVAREDQSFPWFIGGTLAVAVVGRFALALLLPLAAALDWGWGVRWRALVQAHGHLQVIGWLGLFIAGMALRLAPRFAGRPLKFAAVVPAAVVLLIVGLAARAVGQPWLDLPGFSLLLGIGAVAELTGTLLIALAAGATLLPAALRLPSAPPMLLGLAGLVAQATLGLGWLLDLTADDPILAAAHNEVLLSLQFYVFLLPFVIGVSLKALPVFFKRAAPPTGRVWMLTGAIAIGGTLHAASRLMVGGAAGVRLEQTGALMIAAVIAVTISWTGVWRAPERLRPAARLAALLIHTAYAWLAVAALWLTVDGLSALVDGAALAPARTDAVRHILALGVFTTLVTGMAQLMLPWLAMRRQRQGTAQRETWTIWTLLTSATVLRVLGAVLEDRGTGVWAIAGRWRQVACSPSLLSACSRSPSCARCGSAPRLAQLR